MSIVIESHRATKQSPPQIEIASSAREMSTRPQTPYLLRASSQ